MPFSDVERARFFAKVETAGDRDCWAWTGFRNSDGYGRIRFRGKTRAAHRVAFEQLRAPIPDGLTIDHLCRNRACVNPDHLEPVSQRENTLRGDTFAAHHAARTRCPRGHEYDLRRPSGRWCKTCEVETHREARLRARLARNPEGRTCMQCGDAIGPYSAGRPKMYCTPRCQRRAFIARRRVATA